MVAHEALKECAEPGCASLVRESVPRCSRHRKEARRQAETQRHRPHKHLYNTARWKRLRNLKLQRDPLCEISKRHGKIIAATDVDHIKPHRGDWELFFDWNNLQSLCHGEHSRKTASEDGGYGN